MKLLVEISDWCSSETITIALHLGCEHEVVS